MFRKNLFVVYKPVKNNTVLLSDNLYRILQSYDNGCLCINYGKNVHYVSWAPYGSNIADTEIGINSTVAKAIGLKVGTMVKCTLINDVVVLDSLNVTALSQKDWEMLEVSSYRIQSTILDQTKVVSNGQHLVVWINRAMTITLKINRLTPNTSHGRLANNTEIIVAPYRTAAQKLAEIKPISTEELRKENTKNSPKTPPIIQPKITEKLPDDKQTKKQLPVSLLNHNSPSIDSNFDTKAQQFDRLIVDLKKHVPIEYEFRVIGSEWTDLQMCDVCLTTYNLPKSLDFNDVYLLRTQSDKEYYVNVRIISASEIFPQNIYPTIEMNNVLMKHLNVSPLERVTLIAVHDFDNTIERIELSPNRQLTYSETKDVELAFKQFIVDNTKLFPLLINQQQWFVLPGCMMITVTIFPETLKFCTIDSHVLRKCRIQCLEKVTQSPTVEKVANANSSESSSIDKTKNVNLVKYDEIVNRSVNYLKMFLCLDERNIYRQVHNILIEGNENSGKSTICQEIFEQLKTKPFYCYTDVFHCAQHQGRKPETIEKDLREILNNCILYSPSVLLLENLDKLCQTISEEQHQDAEYFNRVSHFIQRNIHEYTSNCSISVIATISSKSALNTRIYSSRGYHLFQKFEKLPDLEQCDRKKIIKKLCAKVKSKSINWDQWSRLTEGYQFGDLVQFVNRAEFYAHRDAPKLPIITNEHFRESLKNTNAYCLQDIENNSEITSDHDDDNDESVSTNNRVLVAGMDNVINVLEEVIVWPAKYPTIFDKAPLKLQSGVLLFGPPGTGKTYLISKLAKQWNLRIITVKGPEVLAKYIGQSEENVRKLFNRARSAKPCILFFDEFDSIAPKRGHDSTGVTDRVVNQLLTELDGVVERKGVIVVAATSRPELLDSALLRAGRLDRHVECGLPNNACRLEIFKTLARTLHLDKSVDFQYFCDKSDNYTGADIQSILTTANMMAVKECLARDSENVPDRVFITQSHLLEAFNDTRPSLTKQDLAKYKNMYARFTNRDKVTGKTPQQLIAKKATLA